MHEASFWVAQLESPFTAFFYYSHVNKNILLHRFSGCFMEKDAWFLFEA